MAKLALQLKGKSDPTEEELAEEIQKMYAEFEPAGRKWVAESPNTLFVMAAGNEGLDNDIMPAFPASIRMPNSITVAASDHYVALADFSNYGSRTVDVAAPGVLIDAAVPSLDNKATLPLSGTSMAAPFVAGVAAAVKVAKPELTPTAIKQILMATVDKKDWLDGKVISGGVVNKERAVEAATLSLKMDLTSAIETAVATVDDVTPRPRKKSVPFYLSKELRELADSAVF